ncbi:MAG: helix-hairpin-helix domain-containing protein [Gemmatimonadota bacterium]
MSPIEGRSLLRGGILLLALSVIRMGLDQARARDAFFPDGDTELPHLLEESREVRDDQARRSAPLAPGETLDPNRSSEEELDRLPGIGPSTARALVEDREEKGGFTRLEDLLRVSGVGPAKLTRISPHLDFSKGVPLDLRQNRSGGGKVLTSRLGPEGVGLAGPSDSVSLPGTRVDLNRASSEELQSLPGIGPALAQRILDSRRQDGPFQTPDDLLRVRGVGPATLARIRALVVPGG